ncbi:unnamed protein product [Linum tenue]|uniref:Uncharacterized protein n=1 Tax=Linum tenue TaxID=586396 RepID=A0AAV0HBW0_9ROSI|nr:unnamed protein product [Linum tenue]
MKSSMMFLFLLLGICLLHGNGVAAQQHAELCAFARIPTIDVDPQYECLRDYCNHACQLKYGKSVLGWCDYQIFCTCFKACKKH